MTTVAVLGTYLPRRCGIATFTSDLCQNLAEHVADTTCFALAVNDTDTGYDYPEIVRFEIHEGDVESYRQAAAYLNMSNVDVVCVQHEYGIFGGQAGSHVLAFLREVRVPVVTTLHTVLRDPDPNQRKVMEQIVQLSDRLVVMSRRAKEFMQQIYDVPEEKIDIIPHGIPDVPFVDPNFFKDKFAVQGKHVLLTFGLLSPNKGIENVIKALPRILDHFPNVVYLVLGATHPHVLRRDGETYRLSLMQLAADLGVDRNVIFHNVFVELDELLEFIGAADIYITPYLNVAQIVSGTLAYTVGAGKAVISTPYWYAQEILADSRGVLVPFGDPQSIAEQVIRLLNNDAERHAMRKRAYLYSRDMVWRKVALRYSESFQKARSVRMRRPRSLYAIPEVEKRNRGLPNINLDHLCNMTDDTGLLQHAVFTVPRYQDGYTTDDNARALLTMVLLSRLNDVDPAEVYRLTARYLAFLWHAFNPETGRFRNWLSFDRRWIDESGSEDGHGRAIRALGMLLRDIHDPRLQGPASRLFDAALISAETFTSPRGWAHVIIGTQAYLSAFPGDRVARRVRDISAARLLNLYLEHRSDDWEWFEDILAYDNAVLPHGLLVAGLGMDREDMVRAGLTSLGWLMSVQCPQGSHFVPIGSNGFYRRGGERARFDQQPIEAASTVSACLEAYRATGDPTWYRGAEMAFEWFLGRNDLRIPLYDSSTGGCRDGLHPDRVNQNEGAESTLAFLQALIEMRSSEVRKDEEEAEQWSSKMPDMTFSSLVVHATQS